MNLRRKFGFFDNQRRMDKLSARVAERDQRISELKDRVAAARAERDKARHRLLRGHG